MSRCQLTGCPTLLSTLWPPLAMVTAETSLSMTSRLMQVRQSTCYTCHIVCLSSSTHSDHLSAGKCTGAGTCDFETDLCGFSNAYSPTDEMDWMRNNGATPSRCPFSPHHDSYITSWSFFLTSRFLCRQVHGSFSGSHQWIGYWILYVHRGVRRVQQEGRPSLASHWASGCVEYRPLPHSLVSHERNQ